MKAIHLRTQYLENPIGIDCLNPEFSWLCQDGIRQTAYQIIVKREGETIWNSGKVVSGSNTHIPYKGSELRSRDRISWEVQLWDENNVFGEVSTASFEMGLLNKEDWKAAWITGNYAPKKNHRYPADYFQKKFTVRKPVSFARLYVTACGFYETYINNQRVGDFVLAPGSTDYRKRLQYQTYDVTELLQENNELQLILGDGWYRGSIGCFGKTNVFGRETKILAQLEIYYEDGKKATIGTDRTFLWSNEGEIRFNDFKDGEIIDKRMHPSYESSAKETVLGFDLIPTASNNVPVIRQEQFCAKKLVTRAGELILDFGQNIAGFLDFTVTGHKGQRIEITLGEILDENGEFTQKNMTQKRPVREFGKLTEILLMTGNSEKLKGELQVTPKQKITLLCSGKKDHYQTRFALFGFRYAKIEADFEIDENEFHSIAVYSAMEQTGEFRCSDPQINQLYSNILWSMRSNFGLFGHPCG